MEASGKSETLCWSVERVDGGRGVGFTGAHFHSNFADDGFRKLVLNAVAWTAGLDIPDKGLITHRPNEKELDENQDFKKPSLSKNKFVTDSKFILRLIEFFLFLFYYYSSYLFSISIPI